MGRGDGGTEQLRHAEEEDGKRRRARYQTNLLDGEEDECGSGWAIGRGKRGNCDGGSIAKLSRKGETLWYQR